MNLTSRSDPICAAMVFAVSALAHGGQVAALTPEAIDHNTLQTTQRTEISFWHTMKDERLTALDDLINGFTLEYPNIKVIPEYVEGYGNLYKKTTKAIGTGQLPDLALAYEPMISYYARKGVVVSLGRY